MSYWRTVQCIIYMSSLLSQWVKIWIDYLLIKRLTSLWCTLLLYDVRVTSSRSSPAVFLVCECSWFAPAPACISVWRAWWIFCGKVGGHIFLKVFVFSFPGGWLPWRGGRLRVTHYLCSDAAVLTDTPTTATKDLAQTSYFMATSRLLSLADCLSLLPVSCPWANTFNSPVGRQLTSCAVLACIYLSLLTHIIVFWLMQYITILLHVNSVTHSLTTHKWTNILPLEYNISFLDFWISNITDSFLNWEDRLKLSPYLLKIIILVLKFELPVFPFKLHFPCEVNYQMENGQDSSPVKTVFHVV